MICTLSFFRTLTLTANDIALSKTATSKIF